MTVPLQDVLNGQDVVLWMFPRRDLASKLALLRLVLGPPGPQVQHPWLTMDPLFAGKINCDVGSLVSLSPDILSHSVDKVTECPTTSPASVD